FFVFFFSSRRRHTRFSRDWSSDVCSSDLFFCTGGFGWLLLLLLLLFILSAVLLVLLLDLLMFRFRFGHIMYSFGETSLSLEVPLITLTFLENMPIIELYPNTSM